MKAAEGLSAKGVLGAGLSGGRIFWLSHIDEKFFAMQGIDRSRLPAL